MKMFGKFADDKKPLKDRAPACAPFRVLMFFLRVKIRELYLNAIDNPFDVVVSPQPIRSAKKLACLKLIGADVIVFEIVQAWMYSAERYL